MDIKMIWAQDKNNVIGNKGKLPWSLPEDLFMFRKLTLYQTVVMGKNTWNSLPSAVQPLPDRRNVVMTKSDFSYSGIEVASSVDEVLFKYPDCWIIGGASVYAAFLPYANYIRVTFIDRAFEGDTKLPFDPLRNGFRVNNVSDEYKSVVDSIPFRYVDSKRIVK